ncbi:MAG: BCD family MFS transporter [Roseiflexaceae bacterium]
MTFLRSAGQFLVALIKTCRLGLPKIGVGWMFALLTVNFNRVTIGELGVAAVLITVMTGMHNFLSPFQVIFGRIADRHPLLGLRRTPYFLGSSLIASLVFLALPSVAQALGRGEPWAFPLGLALLVVFGICIAISGDTHHSLIAEVTSDRSRGGVMAVVWTFTILSTIATAIVIKVKMPTYTPELMQSLYNLTPFVVLGSGLLGLLGVERRLGREELAAALERSRTLVPPGNPLAAAWRLLSDQPPVRGFFAFVFASMLGIFLQDALLEVFGGDIFGLTPGETASFTSTWGGAVLASMLLMGAVSTVAPVSRKTLATFGGAGTAFGLGLLTLCALLGQRALLTPAIVVMGFSTGIFNVGALALMLDMTLEGATGMYMGLWGMAQAFGMGLANVLGGALRTLLIESGAVSHQLGYTAIFGVETLIMLVAVAILRGVSVDEFKGLTRADLVRTIEVSATA